MAKPILHLDDCVMPPRSNVVQGRAKNGDHWQVCPSRITVTPQGCLLIEARNLKTLYLFTASEIKVLM